MISHQDHAGGLHREGEHGIDRIEITGISRSFLTPPVAITLACALTLVFTTIDFLVPGEIDVAILFGLSVGICAWSLSLPFLWTVTTVCLALTYLGQEFGPTPITGHEVLPCLWANRGLVGAGLLALAAFVHQWIRRSERLDAAHALLLAQNRALIESEARFRATFEQAAVGIAHIDLAGRVLRINDRLCEIAGYEREELLSLTFRDITHPDDRDLDDARMRALIAGKIHTYTLEERSIGKDGTARWVSVTRSLACDHPGSPEYAISIIADIAARKRIEADLQHLNETLESRIAERTRELAASNDRLRLALAERDRAEENYRTLYNRAPIPQYSLDPMGRILAVSDTWLALLGYRQEQVLGRSMREFVALGMRSAFDKNFSRLLEQGSLRDIETEMVQATGETMPVLVSAAIQRDEQGRPVRTLGAMVDITERKRVQQERDRLFDLSQDLLIVAQLDGRFRDVNPAVVEAFGLPHNQILATPLIAFVHPEDRQLVRQMQKRVARGESTVAFEVRYQHREGWHWSAWTATAIPDDGIFYGIGRDVHAQRLAEESLRHAQKMEAVGQLTSGISHDFNNMLTTIIGRLEMIAAGSYDEARWRRHALAALQSAEHAAGLVKHLLAFSRHQQLMPRVVRIDEAIRNMVPLWQHALGATIKLSLDLAADLWPCRLDLAQLEAATLNLVINARDAMPNGGCVIVHARNATVTAGAVSELAAGDYILVSVEDTGTGIPAALLSKVVEPFFTTKEVGKGSGLGLSMVYGFVKQSGGTLTIQSTAEAGTTIALYLPRAPSEEMEKAPGEVLEDMEAPFGAKILVAEDEAPGDMKAPSEAKILVVDDDERIRQVTADALKDGGYRVLQAGDAAEALALLGNVGRVDLVVSDIIMPGGMNGVELAQRIRQSACASPVLLITGFVPAPDVSLADAGDLEVLQKPFRPTELRARVHQVIAERTL